MALNQVNWITQTEIYTTPIDAAHLLIFCMYVIFVKC